MQTLSISPKRPSLRKLDHAMTPSELPAEERDASGRKTFIYARRLQ